MRFLRIIYKAANCCMWSILVDLIICLQHTYRTTQFLAALPHAVRGFWWVFKHQQLWFSLWLPCKPTQEMVPSKKDRLSCFVKGRWLKRMGQQHGNLGQHRCFISTSASRHLQLTLDSCSPLFEAVGSGSLVQGSA